VWRGDYVHEVAGLDACFFFFFFFSPQILQSVEVGALNSWSQFINKPSDVQFTTWVWKSNKDAHGEKQVP
jgi:hypothetical protein